MPKEHTRSGGIARLLQVLHPPENITLIGLSVMIGCVSGLGVYLFHLLIEQTHWFIFEWSSEVFGETERIAITLLAPAVGGLLAGSLVWLFSRHDHNHGTAAVMESVALRSGHIDAIPLLAKILAAGLLIGSGGSAGPEDPTVQVGAVAGASVGLRLRRSAERVTTLLTSGVAGAIAAAFNAPIAGVFFALEVIAGNFSTTLFAPVVLAAVVASIIGRALLSPETTFASPVYTLVNPLVETPLYVLLGLLAAVVGVLFIRSVFMSQSLFERLHLPMPLSAGLGGLMVGLLALYQPDILGVGYEISNQILHNSGPIGLTLIIVLIAKIIATSITLGSSHVGGAFAPALVIGGMMGSLFGQMVNWLLPFDVAPAAAYALVGMGATLTAVVRAPITSVLLLFEVTGDYEIILAIMASVAASHLLAQWLHPESIYTERLVRKGIQLRFGRDVNILELVTVGEAMTPDFRIVPHTMNLAQLGALFDHTRHHGVPVVDQEGLLFGVVTLSDLQHATEAKLPLDTPVAQIATRDLVVAYPDQSLNAALSQLALADVGRLPVVDRDQPRRLLGVLRRNDIVKAYRRGAMRRSEIDHRLQQMRLGSHSNNQVLEVTIPDDGFCAGRLLRDLRLPNETIITSIRRQGRSIIPRGDTVLYGGDQLIILTRAEEATQVETHLLEGESAEGETTDSRLRYYELVVPQDAPAVGQVVADLPLPQDLLIVTLKRDGELQAVHGETRLSAGDELILLGRQNDFEEAQLCFVAKGGGGATEQPS
ncbi:MAG: CBS domain-containing protein [Chloroflexaceae bacterium]|nr:CBS domain-containing protein [Chloroflexaceae bacterium]